MGKNGLWAAALALGILGAEKASAVVLVSDNFNDLASGTNLNTRTTASSGGNYVNLVSVSPNGAYVGNTNSFTGDGAGGVIGNVSTAGSAGNRTVAINLSSNLPAVTAGVYDLSLDMTAPASSTTTSWVGFGLSQAYTLTTNIAAGTNNGNPFVIYRQTGELDVYPGPGASVSPFQFTPANTSVLTAGTKHTIDLRIDSTAAQWTLGAFVDGTALDLNPNDVNSTVYTFTTNPTSQYLELSTGYSAGTGTELIDNLSLTGPTPAPEPASVTLVAVAAAAIAGRSRRSTHRA